MPKMLLPDINVWLALAFDGHFHHRAAKQWFESLSVELYLDSGDDTATWEAVGE